MISSSSGQTRARVHTLVNPGYIQEEQGEHVMGLGFEELGQGKDLDGYMCDTPRSKRNSEPSQVHHLQ